MGSGEIALNRPQMDSSVDAPHWHLRHRRRRRLSHSQRVSLDAPTSGFRAAGALLVFTFASSTVATASDEVEDDDDDAGEFNDGGVQTVIQAMKLPGDAVLIRRKRKFWTATKGQHTCDKAPFIFSRDGPSNKNCLPAYNQLGFSCTCLDPFEEDSPVWEFHVATKAVLAGTPRTKIASTSTFNVTKIAPFVVPGSVTTIKIIGQGPGISTFEFLPDVTNKGQSSDSKLRAAQGSEGKLYKVHFENVDVSGAITNPYFFPDSVTNLTLRNCNVTDGSSGFLVTLSNLAYINLENNALTKIPSEILRVASSKEIYLRGNRIANVTLTDIDFQAVDTAKMFDMDVSASAEGPCPGGAMKTTKGITFCVSNGATDEPRAETETSSSSGSQTSLFVGVICGCSVVVVILIFLIVRRRSSRKKEEAFAKQLTSQSLIDDTLNFDHSEDSKPLAIDSSLLNDPIIITHRIPHNDVKVATCISRGGFGLVYSGTFNRRRVAIKRIRSELSADIKYIEAFLKEICLMASLSHPRIVEFVGVSWDSLRNLSAVTEFMERGDLRDVLHSSKERNARLSWDGHKSRIAMHIAEALTYLHSLSPKVIHRDLKSKNVLLDIDMTAKLSDFGVSRERRFEETHMTAGIGTAFWIAPEVLLGMDYDERADIFSFGVVLSEIDTDDYPYWNEKNPASGGKQQENVILRMVATGALRPEFSASCPRAILELAFECLDVDPLKRPTAAEIAYRLQQLIKSSPLTATSAFSTDCDLRT